MCLFAAGIFCNQYFWNIALTKIGLKPLMVSKALYEPLLSAFIATYHFETESKCAGVTLLHLLKPY